MINSQSDYNEFLVGDKTEWIHYIMNLDNPPKIFNREQFDKLMSRLDNDECVVLTFLPPPDRYNDWVGQIKPHDRYSASKVKNLSQLNDDFKQLKFQSPNNKAQYLIIDSEELAKRLNISYHNAGDIYVLRRTSNLINNESNFIYSNVRCHLQKVEPPITKNIETSDFQFKLNFLQDASLPYINQINLTNDFTNFIRTVSKAQSQKLLVVCINEDEKPEFQQRVEKVLFELKKVFKDELSILLTRNKQLLQNELHISPDEFVTLRLLNLKK
jgi:hypothetical protein